MGVVAAQLGVTGIIPNTTGLGKSIAQQIPTFILLETNNTLAQVLVSGFLNASKQTFGIPYSNQQIALVYTTDAGSVWLQIAVTGTAPNYVYSLIGSSDVASVFIASLGSAAAPSYTFSGDIDTGMYSSGANAVDFSTGGVKRAEITSAGLAVTGLISATTSITAGTSLTATAGALTSGSVAGGFVGSLILYSTTAANGSLRLLNVGNAGNFAATISNVTALGQASVYTMPDPANAIARFLVGATATPFISGNIPQASGTGGLMVDSGVSFASLAPVTVSVTMNTASVIGAYATPVQIVAGQAGKAIMILAAQIVTEVSTPFATGGIAQLQWGNTNHAGGTVAADATIPAAEITAAASQIYTQYGVVTTTVTATAGVTGLGVYFTNATGAYTNGTGSTVTVTLQYMLISAI